MDWRLIEPRNPGEGIRGAMGGSRIFEQPQYRAEAESMLEFIAGPQRVVVEIGFDHGMRLLAQAHQNPDTRFVGLEVRERQVLRVAPHCPDNLRVFRADARTVFGAVLPDACVTRVEVLFPTPWWVARKRERRLLMTESFVTDVKRVLRPGGDLYLATDVAGYFSAANGLFGAWTQAELPAEVGVLSRRERVCKRDGLTVYRACFRT